MGTGIERVPGVHVLPAFLATGGSSLGAPLERPEPGPHQVAVRARPRVHARSRRQRLGTRRRQPEGDRRDAVDRREVSRWPSVDGIRQDRFHQRRPNRYQPQYRITARYTGGARYRGTGSKEGVTAVPHSRTSSRSDERYSPVGARSRQNAATAGSPRYRIQRHSWTRPKLFTLTQSTPINERLNPTHTAEMHDERQNKHSRPHPFPAHG